MKVVFLVYITSYQENTADVPVLPQFYGVFDNKQQLEAHLNKKFGPDESTRKWYVETYSIVINHRLREVLPNYADTTPLDARTTVRPS